MRIVLLATALCTLLAAAPASQPATSRATSGATTRATTRAGDEQAPPKIHRWRAGVLDRTGWCVARSTGSGFTVSLPRQFNDITVSHREDDGSVVVTHMIATADPVAPSDPLPFRGVRFAASATSSPTTKLPPDAADQYVTMLARHGEVRNKRSVKMDGIAGTEFEIMTAKTCTRYRVAQRENIIYSLKAEVSEQEFVERADANVSKFFESFRFPTPQAKDAPGATASRETP